MSLLQERGHEDWKRRVGVPDERLQQLMGDVKLRDRKPANGGDRPLSLAERLSWLEGAQDGWKNRVEEKDVKQFTIEARLAKSGRTPGAVDSPLMNRKKKAPRMPLNRAQSTPNIPSSLVSGDATHSSAGETDMESAASSRVAVPAPADEDFTTFFEAPTGKKSAEKVAVTLDDFDHVFMEAHDILSSAKKARPSRKQAGSRNPLRKLAARADIQTEYTETRSDVVEKEMKRIKKEQMVGQTVFAQEALAGLAAKVSFDKVTLKKTDALKAPGPAGNLLPYRDLMLIHIKGRRHCQLRLVEPRAASLNGGDCFLLVTRTHVFIWVGEYANVIEKAKASEVASYVQQKRDLGCQSATEPIVVNETTQDNPAGKKFWSALGEIGAYQDPGPVEEDELYEMYMAETNMAYRLTDDETLVPVEEFWGNVLKHELLSSKQAFVFDFGGEMYVWTGKHVPFAQRKLAIRLARELWDRGYDYTDCDINPVCPLKTCENGGLPLKCAERPAWCMFAKVNDNMETILFKEKFIDWPDSSRLIKVKDNDDDKKEEPVLELTAYDVDKMLPIDTSPVKLVLEGTNVGRGQSWSEIRDGLRRSYDVLTLGMDVWHVMEYDHYQVEAPSHGQFHEGDTYVIRWHYMVSLAGMKDLRGNAAARHSMTGREKCAYFFWQGRHSSVTEKGASALMTVELDEERGPQVRVVQGKEPPAFLSLFSGRMTTHVGKREDEATNTPGPWRLYVVRHELPNETCLNEVSVRVSSLRSRASFLLINTQKAQLLVWHGAKSTNRGQAEAIAETIAERCPLEMGLKSGGCKLSVTVLEEGAENSTWRAAMETAGDPRLDQYLSLKGDKREFNDTPRLWQLSSVRGVFEAIEVMNPSRSPDTVCAFPVLQTDLYKQAQPALLLLDAGVLGVWLWQGWWPREEEGKENVKTGSATARFNTDRKCALETCINYCKAKPSASPPLLVFAGLEPVAFTSLFPEWVPDTDVAAIMAEDGRAPGDTADVRQLLHKLSRDRYSWQELLAVPLPEGVDAGRLESYLEDDEFEDVLGLTRDEFYALPAWRQGNIKKDAGLF
jgi:supervillin